MSELKIEIPVQAKLDSKSSKGLESQISGAVENKVFEVKAKIGEASLASIQAQIKKAIETSLGNTSLGFGNQGNGRGITPKIRFDIDVGQSNLNAVESRINTLASKVQVAFKGAEAGAQAGINSVIDKARNDLVEAQKALSNLRMEGINTTGIADYSEHLKKVNASLKEGIATLAEYKSAQVAAAAATDKGAASTKKYNSSIDTIQNKLSQMDWLRQNYSRAFKDPAWDESFKSLYAGFQNALERGASPEEIDRLSKSLSNLKEKARAAGEAGKTFGQRFQEGFAKFANWFSISQLFMGAINKAQQMVQVVKEIDKAMTSVRKVTDESSASYARYMESALSRSADLAAQVPGYIEATAGWARMGYGMEEAKKLGELSTIYYNVGDGVETVDDATNSLISTMKAFSIQAEDAEGILDKLNYVGNNFGITSGGLGEILQRSAASLSAANTDLIKSIAIGTAGNEIINDPQKVGNGLKTLSMRLRGSTAELEAAGEEVDEYVTSTSKMREGIKALTGVDIMKSATEYKDIYQILLEINKEFGNLTDVSKASLVEMMFGKVQGNLGTAILKNFGTAEKIYKELTEGMAEGSARKEYDTYLDSVEGKANKLSATLAKTSVTFLDPETLKQGYSILTDILNLINGIAETFGGINTAAGLAMGALTLFKPNTGFLQDTGKGWPSFFWNAWGIRREQMESELQNDLQLLEKYQSVLGDQGKMDLYKGNMSMLAQTKIDFAAIAEGGESAKKAVDDFTESSKKMQQSLTFGGKLKALGQGITSFGKSLLVAGAQMAIVTIAFAAIDYIGKKIDDWVHAYERSAEKVEEINDKWADMAEKQKEVQKITTGDSAERLLELSKGVDRRTGENIALTTEEYKEYQDLANQLASKFPSLVSYWDSEGNAVLNLKNNIADLREELLGVYKDYEQGDRLTRIKDFQDNAEDYQREAFAAGEGTVIKTWQHQAAYDTLSDKDKFEALIRKIFTPGSDYNISEDELIDEALGEYLLSAMEAKNAAETTAYKEGKENWREIGVQAAVDYMLGFQGEIARSFFGKKQTQDLAAQNSLQNYRQYIADLMGTSIYNKNKELSNNGREKISQETENILLELATKYLSDVDLGQISTKDLGDKFNEEWGSIILGPESDKFFASLAEFDAAYQLLKDQKITYDEYKEKIVSAGMDIMKLASDDHDFDEAIRAYITYLLNSAMNTDYATQATAESVKLYDNLKESYTKYTEAREKAISALSNLNETGYVTPEDMESIRSAGLEGALRQTAYGSVYVDYARMRELDRGKAQEEIGEQLDFIRQQTEACTKAQEELNTAVATGDKERAEGLRDSISAYAQNIEGAHLMISALEKSTSALNAFKEAMNSMDLDDNFKSAKSALDEILKALETGKFNTDQFVTAMELVGGTDFLEKFRQGIISEKDLGDWVENLGKYYTEDGEIDRRRAFDRFVDADIGHYFEGENGETRFAFNQGTTMQDIQDALGGISGELATAFLDAINAYAKDPDTETIGPEDYKKESERRKEAEEALKQVQQMNVSAQNISLNADNVTVEGDQGSGDGGEKDPNQSPSPAQASTPIPIADITSPWLNENGEPIVSELTIDSTGVQTTIENLKQEASEIEANIILGEIGTEAIQKLKEEVDNPIKLQVGADASEGTTSVQNLETFAKQRVVKPVAANTSNAIAAANTLHSNLSRPATKTVFVRQIGGGTLLGGGPIAADGTDNAKGGTTLVGEIAPEIIVSRKTGTWRLVESPQLTNLGRGDIVFNGEQTKKILAGKPASMGKALAGGSNNKKWTYVYDYNGHRVTASTPTLGGRQPIGKYATNNTNSQTVPGGKGGSSGKGGGGGSGGAGGNEEPESLVRDLYDWIERAIEVAKKATQKLIDAVAEKVGYINKNKTLDEALTATAKEIEVNQAGYDRYMEHVKSLQQKYGFGDDMLERAKNGEINIADYEGDLKNQVEDFVMWYEKAEKAQETVEELKQQEVDLARQKLDNIDEYYTKKVDRLEAALDKNSAKLDKKVAAGQEVTAKDYEDAIKATQDKILTLQEEREAFASQFDALIASGVITPDSDKWHEYMSTLEDIDQTIIETETDLIGLNDEMAQIPLTNLQYALDRLNAIQSQIKGFQSFHDAQGTDNTESTYNDLIQNGFEQIKNLQEQNEYLKAQQSGLDVLSEKWQELQGQIDDNNDSIWDIKASQEEWNDAIADLKIEQLQKQRDELEKTNEALEKKKEMEDALEELERAKTQRTKLIYREGVKLRPLT